MPVPPTESLPINPGDWSSLNDYLAMVQVVGGAADDGQAAVVAPSCVGWANGIDAAKTANQIELVRFAPRRTRTITSIAFVVTTAATNDDPVDVGICQALDGVTYTRLVSSGATFGKLNVLGRQVVSIAPTTVTAGQVYYATIAYGPVGGTAVKVAFATLGTGANSYLKLFGLNPGIITADFKAASYPIPASVASPAGGLNTPTILALNGI